MKTLTLLLCLFVLFISCVGNLGGEKTARTIYDLPISLKGGDFPPGTTVIQVPEGSQIPDLTSCYQCVIIYVSAAVEKDYRGGVDVPVVKTGP
jgi:hypothetical protein